MTKNKKEINEKDEKQQMDEGTAEEAVSAEEDVETSADEEGEEPEDELSQLKSEAAEYLDGWQRALAFGRVDRRRRHLGGGQQAT